MHAKNSECNNKHQATNNDNNGVQSRQHAAVWVKCKMPQRNFFSLHFGNFLNESYILALKKATIVEIGAPKKMWQPALSFCFLLSVCICVVSMYL